MSFNSGLFNPLSWLPVLWISGRPVAKCDPLRDRAIQHDHQSRPMGNPSPARWGHDQMENMQILC